MVLSKGLRRLMVSSAALLMFVSAGAASAGNMNVNAKRRHVRVSRRAHVRRHSYAHHKRHAVAAYAKSSAKHATANNLQLDNSDSWLNNASQNTVSPDDDSGVPMYINDADNDSFDASIQNDTSLPAKSRNLLIQAATPYQANAPRLTSSQEASLNNDQSSSDSSDNPSDSSNTPTLSIIEPRATAAATMKDQVEASKQAKVRANRRNLLNNIRSLNRKSASIKARLNKKSPSKIFRILKQAGTFKGLSRRSVKRISRHPNLIRQILNQRFGKAVTSVKPKNRRTKRNIRSIMRNQKALSKKGLSRSKKAKETKLVKQDLAKVLNEQGIRLPKGSRVIIQL